LLRKIGGGFQVDFEFIFYRIAMMRSQVIINYETLVEESDNRKRNRFACKQTTVQEKFEKNPEISRQ